jgi:hypothetical protein
MARVLAGWMTRRSRLEANEQAMFGKDKKSRI